MSCTLGLMPARRCSASWKMRFRSRRQMCWRAFLGWSASGRFAHLSRSLRDRARSGSTKMQIVTEEKPQGTLQRPNIPDVCNAPWDASLHGLARTYPGRAMGDVSAADAGDDTAALMCRLKPVWTNTYSIKNALDLCAGVWKHAPEIPRQHHHFFALVQEFAVRYSVLTSASCMTKAIGNSPKIQFLPCGSMQRITLPPPISVGSKRSSWSIWDYAPRTRR